MNVQFSQWTKGQHALNLFRRPWNRADRMLSMKFPRRTATIPPASWVEELMAKRFGALMICGACAVKYRDGISRWAYVRHPDMKAQGNACDFCKTVYDVLPLWMKEEHQYPTRQQHHEDSLRSGVNSPTPHVFDRRRFAHVSR